MVKIKHFKRRRVLETVHTRDDNGKVLDRYIKEENNDSNESERLNRIIEFIDGMRNAQKSVIANNSKLLLKAESQLEAYELIRGKILAECEFEEEKSVELL